jgi:hypothetical protein
VIAAAAAVLVLAVGVGVSSAQPAPPIPTPPIPNPPNVHIPGEKVVKFKLVFDGTSTADRVADIGGQAGGCDAQLHADIKEDVTYGRGKGVTMEFVRFKEGKHFRYGFQRSGRNLDSSFNVVATVNRTASGAGDLLQHPGSVQCNTTHFEAGQNPDCGTPKTDNEPWGLRVVNDHFIPRPVRPAAVGALVDHCGEPPSGSGFGDDIADLNWGWPTVPAFIFEKIPLHKMFNKRVHAFAVHFTTLDKEASGKLGTPPLTGNTEDHGSAEATVRFIRQ